MGEQYRWESFEGPGGKDLDEAEYKREGLRADLVILASQISFQHGPGIVDKILEKYEVTEK